MQSKSHTAAVRQRLKNGNEQHHYDITFAKQHHHKRRTLKGKMNVIGR